MKNEGKNLPLWSPSQETQYFPIIFPEQIIKKFLKSLLSSVIIAPPLGNLLIK